MVKIDELTDFEKSELQKFLSIEKRTQEEIEEFLKILISLREKPIPKDRLQRKE